MNLVASLIVRNERSRYLEACIEALLEFVDEIRVLDDASDDGTFEILNNGYGDRVQVAQLSAPQFFVHEGKTRQALLEWTLLAEPTHVLAIDADEFVSDGPALRSGLESGRDVYTLNVREVWQADEHRLGLRVDGGWRPHAAPILYAVTGRRLTITERALACGREPEQVRARWREAEKLPVDLLHFGWAREAERVDRHARYAVADGGRFHASSHLASILWPARRVRLEMIDWPAGLLPSRDAILGTVPV